MPIQLRDVLLTTQHTIHTNIQTDGSSHVKVAVILRGFVAYGVWEPECKAEAKGAGTWQHDKCVQMLLS